MRDRDLPELPSYEELGITEEDLEEYAGEEEESGAPAREPRPASPPGPPPPPREEAPARPSPARPWRGPSTLALLVILAFAFRMDGGLPEAVPVDAPDTAFSSGRAMVDLVEIAREAHPTGSPEHGRIRGFLLDRLEALGLEPEVQTAVSLRRQGERVRAATVRNVLARIPGTESTGAIVLMAHYDSRGVARGAGDDGSGTVAILETLRALRSLPPLRNDILVLISDAEEVGLMGARAFVEQHPWMEDVALVLSLEMRGGGGPSIMFETGAGNGWIVEALGEGDPRPTANSLSYEVYRRLPNDTDFTPFREAGVQGLNFAAIGNPHVYHQQYDAPDRYDERTLQHHGLHLLGMVRELGDRDLANVDGPDRVFFSLPLVGLVTYPPTVGYALAVLLVLVAALAFALVRRGGGGAAGIAVGLVLSLVVMGGAAGGAWLLFSEVQPYHPEFGALHGSAFHVEGWYVAAIVAAALALTVVLLHLLRGRFGLGALTLGAAVPVVLGGVVLPFVAPLGAMNLQWPALFMLLGVGVVAGVEPVRRPGVLRWLGLLLLGGGVLVFMVPLSQLLWTALSLEAAAIVGGVLGLSVIVLLPLLDTLRDPGGWWSPILAAALATAFVGVGLLHARPSPERPAPSTLIYTLDHEAEAASWATVADGGQAWAGQRAGAAWDTASARSLEEYLLGGRPYLSAPAPPVRVPRPWAVVEGASSSDGRRTLSLSVRSAVGAEMIALRIPTSEDVFLRRVGSRPVPEQDPEDRSGARRARTVQHWGVPDSALTVELNVGGTVDTLALEVIEHHLRPGEVVGASRFLRPPNLAPNVVARSDRAVFRSIVRVVPATGAVLESPGREPAAGPEGEEEGEEAPATPTRDTLAPDALPDTMAPDTMAPDTMAPDTAAPDTMAPGGIGRLDPGPTAAKASPQPAPVSSSLSVRRRARASSSYAWSWARAGRIPR